MSLRVTAATAAGLAGRLSDVAGLPSLLIAARARESEYLHCQKVRRAGSANRFFHGRFGTEVQSAPLAARLPVKGLKERR
jgi:hypothetical protein